ncbi:serine hydrolase domain-containing protein [Novosphingobium sp.]|uniref:serine hydrolase domain-containing protein n=1 Tax=Novosphingobium sp. TaxID=1874826 RepID=UPI0035B3A4F9
MLTRRLPLILPLLALPALIGCSGGKNDEGPPPLSPAALSAVVEQPGVPREALARAVDALFTQDDMGETRAVLVIHDGRIVAERYAPPYHENTRFISWSMAKTVTGVMIGMLVADGRLRLDESVPIPAWQRPGDPRGEITLRQLLQMRSGLRHTEAGNPPYESDEVRMLFLDGRDDMAAYAEAQPLEAEPGRKWEYSTATTVILADLAARALTTSTDPAERRRVVGEYLRTRLFEPLGMKSMVPEYDAAGTLIGGSLIHGSARDWAKFGEFLRNNGAVKGAQLVPSGWIEFMISPNPRNPGYGAQIWLNRPQADDGHIEFPGAAQSVFSMNGHLGQFVVISQSQHVTVVRLGKTEEGKHAPVRLAISRIIQLFPKETQ